MTRTEFLCAFLRGSGIAGLRAGLLRRSRAKSLTILAYHRVAEMPTQSYPFDREVISCTPAEFELEMRFVGRYFEVISFRDIIREGIGRYRNPLVITFDDGYRDNHDVALPILRQYGLKATFCIITGFVGTGQIPWWDEIAWLVRNSQQNELILSDCPLGRLSLVNEGLRQSAVGLLLKTAKTIPDGRRRLMMDELRRQSVAPPVSLTKDLMMEWAHIKELAKQGMEIGSHTVSHPVLGNLEDRNLLFNELAESKARLENETGCPVDVLSYPVGGRKAIDDEVAETAKKLGYRFGCLYEHGVNPIAGFDPFRLLRIKSEVGSDFNRFVCKALFPMLVKY